MTPEESIAWKPEWPGGSTDILPFYDTLCPPMGGTVVEIGCFFGRSIGFLALRRPDLVLLCVDPWDDEWVDAGEQLPVGPDRERRDKYGGMFAAFKATLEEHAPGVFERLDIRRGYSKDRLAEISDASVDVCFIDGDHTTEGVRCDIQHAKRIVKPGGIIAGHDYHVQRWGGPVTLGVQAEFGDHYQLAPWPYDREGWEPGHSSVWYHRVPLVTTAWHWLCDACWAGRQVEEASGKAGDTQRTDCEACGETLPGGRAWPATDEQFAATKPRIAVGGAFVPEPAVEPFKMPASDEFVPGTPLSPEAEAALQTGLASAATGGSFALDEPEDPARAPVEPDAP
jgi:SAM-dependent methyltransferase